MTAEEDRNAYVRQLGRQARKAGTITRIPTSAEQPEARRVSPQEAFAVVRLAREAKRAAAQEARAAAAPGGDGTDEQTADKPADMNGLLRAQLTAGKAPEQEP
jgi:putative intracellular protease/amidase